jgi:cation:H+ antiporter
MQTVIQNIIEGLPLPVLFTLAGVFMYMLGKGADILVDEAISLSVKWNVPKMFVGATIVSLGTTFPEAAVSVTAAVKGEPDLALGNAVGSIICDTGLILGLCALISPLPLNRDFINRHGLIQVGSGFLLVVSCTPFLAVDAVFTDGGRLPQYMGVIFLILLVAYMVQSFRWVQDGRNVDSVPDENILPKKSKAFFIIVKLSFASFLVVSSSQMLIPVVLETAVRLSVPSSIISATVVAFGTSLPELITSLTAVRKGYGELAVGNVIGADILNVLFVAGAAASVSKGGLVAPGHFFELLFPAMLLVLLIFRIGIGFSSKGKLNRQFGMVLLTVYLLVTYLSYTSLKV